MGKPNFYDPETWKDLSQETKIKLMTIQSWIDGTNEQDEITADDWERDF
jgi:hypothetical protein